MHEIGVLEEAVRTIVDLAEENDIPEVKSITFDVGELTGYLPVFFEQYFPVVVEKKPVVKNAKLHMNIIPGEGLCMDCETMYNVMKCEGKCPKCGSIEKKVLSGTKFMIKEIGY